MNLTDALKVWETVAFCDAATMNQIIAARTNKDDILHIYNEVKEANPDANVISKGWAPYFISTMDTMLGHVHEGNYFEALRQATGLRCILSELFNVVAEQAPDIYNAYVTEVAETFSKALEAAKAKKAEEAIQAENQSKPVIEVP